MLRRREWRSLGAGGVPQRLADALQQGAGSGVDRGEWPLPEWHFGEDAI
jgi:hypothetical protein